MDSLFVAMGFLFVLNVLVAVYVTGLTRHVNEMVDIINSSTDCINNHAEVINKVKDQVNVHSDTITTMIDSDVKFEEEYNKLVDSFNRLSEYTMAVSDLVETQHYTIMELEANGEIKIPQENKDEIVEAKDRIDKLYEKLEEDFELVEVNEDEC